MSIARSWGAVTAIVLVLRASTAGAQSGAAEVEKLNKQALEAYDSLSFDQAKTLLEQALAEAQSAGLSAAPVAARTHLNLGMVLIAGFQEARGPGRGAQRDEAIEHFRAALKIQPEMRPPPGLFNPEVQSVFDETKAKVDREKAEEPPAQRPVKTRPEGEKQGEGEGEDDAGEEAEEAPASGSPIFLSLALGSGFGVAKGHLDANKDIMPTNSTVADNSWSGGLAPSRLGHIVVAAGYFISTNLMLSVEGRLQIISGTTSTPMTPRCVPSCTPPGTAFAGLAKANWFLSAGPLRPFVLGGVGGGSIRQVVKIDGPADCGKSANQQCVDTVTGGPLLVAVGGGVVYELGSLALLGTITANAGVPKLMLNIDAIVGLGLRL